MLDMSLEQWSKMSAIEKYRWLDRQSIDRLKVLLVIINELIEMLESDNIMLKLIEPNTAVIAAHKNTNKALYNAREDVIYEIGEKELLERTV